MRPKQRAGMRSKLRQAWGWYNPERKQAYKESVRIWAGGRAWHQCDRCLVLFPKKEVACDHINPIGPAPGTRNAPSDLTWPQFFERMWCPLSNLRILCKPCHKVVGKEERERKKNEQSSAQEDVQ